MALKTCMVVHFCVKFKEYDLLYSNIKNIDKDFTNFMSTGRFENTDTENIEVFHEDFNIQENINEQFYEGFGLQVK